jgi:hypothetical protein
MTTGSAVKDGDTNWSTKAVTAYAEIDLEQTYRVERVDVHWSGGWGADTYKWSLALFDATTGKWAEVYETSAAPKILGRVDKVNVPQGTCCSKVRVYMLGRHGGEHGGYAISEVQVIGFDS